MPIIDTGAFGWVERAIDDSETIAPDGLLEIAAAERAAADLKRRIKSVEGPYDTLRGIVDRLAPQSALVDRISAIFVPVVVAVAIVTLIVWLALGAEFSTALLNAVNQMTNQQLFAAIGAAMDNTVGARHAVPAHDQLLTIANTYRTFAHAHPTTYTLAFTSLVAIDPVALASGVAAAALASLLLLLLLRPPPASHSS